MSGSEAEADGSEDTQTQRTGMSHECRRCGREQGLVGKYDIWLCRQCFREIAREMGFKKYS
ncbi:MAG: 30S ribosomal protein S14 [Halobacteriaceae archaeon]